MCSTWRATHASKHWCYPHFQVGIFMSGISSQPLTCRGINPRDVVKFVKKVRFASWFDPRRKSKVRSPKTHFGLALVISILFWNRPPSGFWGEGYQAVCCLSFFVWLISAIALLIWVFLITGRRNLKRRLNNGIPTNGVTLSAIGVNFPWRLFPWQ